MKRPPPGMVLKCLALLIVFVLGVGIGTADKKETETRLAAAERAVGVAPSAGTASVEPVVRTKVVEKLVRVPVEKVVEKRVAVETTPASCRRALALARQGFGVAADGFFAVADFLGAAAELDVYGMEAGTADLNEKASEMGQLAPAFNAAAGECESN